VSFFDEDDEPARTTTRTRPRPRRGTPVGGRRGGPDQQQVLIRRMIGILIVALFIIVAGLLIKGCGDRRHKAALTDYTNEVNQIGQASAQTGAGLFTALNRATNESPEDLQQSISSLRVSADEHLTRARNLSVPGDMSQAQQSLLIALEFRRDALSVVASQIRTALGDQGDQADKAITRMAGEMRRLDASDVLYHSRVVPFISDALVNGDVNPKPTILDSLVLNEISWISPDYFAGKLGQQLGASNKQGGNQPTGPGLHGTGLNGTSYGNVTLSPTAPNRLTYVAGQAFTVSFTNQGDNDEFNVKVTLKIARDSGTPITLNKTVQKVAKGEKATVTLPLNSKPPAETALTITVNVAAVPGETKTDNNKSSYSTLFSSG
jgi:hypothetical protein